MKKIFTFLFILILLIIPIYAEENNAEENNKETKEDFPKIFKPIKPYLIESYNLLIKYKLIPNEKKLNEKTGKILLILFIIFFAFLHYFMDIDFLTSTIISFLIASLFFNLLPIKTKDLDVFSAYQMIISSLIAYFAMKFITRFLYGFSEELKELISIFSGLIVGMFLYPIVWAQIEYIANLIGSLGLIAFLILILLFRFVQTIFTIMNMKVVEVYRKAGGG